MNLGKKLIKSVGSVLLVPTAAFIISGCEERKSYIYDREYFLQESAKNDQESVEDMVSAREKIRTALKDAIRTGRDTTGYHRQIEIINISLEELYKEGRAPASTISSGYLDRSSEDFNI